MDSEPKKKKTSALKRSHETGPDKLMPRKRTSAALKKLKNERKALTRRIKMLEDELVAESKNEDQKIADKIAPALFDAFFREQMLHKCDFKVQTVSRLMPETTDGHKEEYVDMTKTRVTLICPDGTEKIHIGYLDDEDESFIALGFRSDDIVWNFRYVAKSSYALIDSSPVHGWDKWDDVGHDTKFKSPLINALRHSPVCREQLLFTMLSITFTLPNADGKFESTPRKDPKYAACASPSLTKLHHTMRKGDDSDANAQETWARFKAFQQARVDNVLSKLDD